MVSNEQIRKIGRAILLYGALPALKQFHASQRKFRFLLGGNRSGKTHGLCFDMCAFALNVHPYRVTPENATIWVCSDTWDLLGKIIWTEKLQGQQFLPPSQIKEIVWHNRGANIPRELRLINNNTIEFKAFSQGRDLFQGRAINSAYLDEQCRSGALEIFQEITARLIDRDGFLAWSMTPLRYQSWLEERIKNPKPTDGVFFANLLDNKVSRGGFIPDEQIDIMVKEWPVEVRQTRIEGKFASFAGAVYKTFNIDCHVCKPFEIPKEWSRFRAIDFGYNNPFACLWLARDPDGRWIIYNEHYQARETLAYHAERIKQISKAERYRMTWADHDSQDCAELRSLGIHTTPARKDVHLGIEAVQACLKVQGDGRPRLQIFDNCKNTIREIQGYRWAEGTETRDAKDEPLKMDDHLDDCLRYGIYGIEGK